MLFIVSAWISYSFCCVSFFQAFLWVLPVAQPYVLDDFGTRFASRMKGLSGGRSHHHGVACDPACDSLPHHQDRKPYLLNPVDPHPTDHPYYTQRNSFQAECMVPYNDQIASSTFPRRHYSSHHELKDECALVPHGTANKTNRIPANLLDQFERQLPLNRDGYHTLQYKRTAMEHRSDSPGRIRHLVHSVQKLFTKSHSLEGPSKGSVNGGKASPEESQTMRYGKRSKSKERRSEGKPRSNASGWWSSDDNLDNDVCIYHGPSGVMTMGRCPDRSSSQYFMEAYNTISEHTVKSSRSNNDVKCSTCANLPVNLDSQLMKKSSWSSTLTVSRAREVYQKASVNMDQTVVKAETCQQERSCQYLQVQCGELVTVNCALPCLRCLWGMEVCSDEIRMRCSQIRRTLPRGHWSPNKGVLLLKLKIYQHFRFGAGFFLVWVGVFCFGVLWFFWSRIQYFKATVHVRTGLLFFFFFMWEK